MVRTILSLAALVLFLSFSQAGFAEDLKDGREIDIPKNKLPEKIAKAAVDAVPGGKVADIDRDIKGGKSTWQIGVDAGGKTIEVIIDDDGKVLSKVEVQSEKLKVTDLPAAVVEGVKKEFPGAKITTAEKLMKGTVVSYEMDVDVQKKTFEVVFTSEGKMISKAEAKDAEPATK